MKTSDLIGKPLDWAVLEASGAYPDYVQWREAVGDSVRSKIDWFRRLGGSPSTNWSQGGPIIDREGIYLRAVRRDGHSLDGKWLAQGSDSNTGGMVQWVKREDWRRHYYVGPTLLIAAMRCYVASKLGDEVEIPEELL